jgi:predicted DNA-binding transcriptional regulator AlpA
MENAPKFLSTATEQKPTPNVGFIEAEAAIYLRLKIYTLRKWRREGTGPKYIRCGARLIRYMQADIDAWLEQRKFNSNAHELSAKSQK